MAATAYLYILRDSDFGYGQLCNLAFPSVPLIRELWKDLPTEKEKEEFLNDIQIDAMRILPADHGYYTFAGSLTPTPCSEDVTWFVLKHRVTVSAAEIEPFAKLYRNDARPTQQLYDRVVLENKE